MPLDRPTILQQAFAVLNESGLENLTLRRLAARLGVQAPALYWHFRSKQELLDEMSTQVFREAVQEAPPSDLTQDWQDWAVQYACGLRRALLRYRDGARMFSGAYLTDASLYASMDAALCKFVTAGFPLRQATVALGALYNYAVGFVIEEQAIEPTPGKPNPQYDLAHREQRIDPKQFPLAYAAGKEMFSDRDGRFGDGVQLIVTGISTLRTTPQPAIEPVSEDKPAARQRQFDESFPSSENR